jgi:hypothetical protein
VQRPAARGHHLPPHSHSLAVRDVRRTRGVSHKRVLNLCGFLNQPLARFMQRQLRDLYLKYDAGRDILKLVDEVEELQRKFEGAPVEAEPSGTPAVLEPEDVHLVCFEYVR